MIKYYGLRGKHAFYSFLFSLYFLIPTVNKIITVYFPSVHFSIMSLLYAIIGLLIICWFIFGKNKIIDIGRANILVFFLVLLYYVVSILLGYTRTTIFECVVYIFIPILFFFGKCFDINVFIKTTLIVSLFGLPVINSIFVLDYNGLAEMGVSYAFLLPATVPIYYLLRHKKKTILYVAFSILNLLYDLQIFLHGSRGCIVSIGAVFFLLLFFRFSGKNAQTKTNIKLIFIALGFTVVLVNLDGIINLFIQFLSSLGIASNSLNKMLLLIQNGDISNGRNEIYEIAFNGIADRPLFGSGFDSFDHFTGLGYPHNFIVQWLYDLGLVGFLAIFIPFILGTYRAITRSSRDELYLFLVMFGTSVPGALFSQNAWKNVLLWTTISISISCLGPLKAPSTYDEKIDKKIAVSEFLQ